MQAAEERYLATSQKVRNFHAISYAAATWDRARRVIVKAERLREGPNVRFVVTSLKDVDETAPRGGDATNVDSCGGDATNADASRAANGRTPAEIYDGLYTARGEMENRIKEQQLALFADRTSCHDFLANPFRLLLSSAAYARVEHLRRTALVETELADAQAGTIRLKLFKVAARVVVSVRRVWVRLSSACPYAALFAVARRNLRAAYG